MVAQTTDDILRELDRTEGGPVQFEDPRNHARYMLIPQEDYHRVAPLLDGNGERRGATVQWNETKNERRWDLIDRKYASGLSAEELTELNDLQDELYRYRAQVAPLPLKMLELMKEGLERQAERRASADA
jgi:hypothetical protein